MASPGRALNSSIIVEKNDVNCVSCQHQKVDRAFLISSAVSCKLRGVTGLATLNTKDCPMKMTCLVLIILLSASPALATETVDRKEGGLPVAAKTVAHKAQDLKKKFTDKPTGVFHLVGAEIEPGTRQDLRWFSPQSFGAGIPTVVMEMGGFLSLDLRMF
jgi:hypothetical protein